MSEGLSREEERKKNGSSRKKKIRFVYKQEYVNVEHCGRRIWIPQDGIRSRKQELMDFKYEVKILEGQKKVLHKLGHVRFRGSLAPSGLTFRT